MAQKVNWTKEQKQAIDARNGTLLVSAAAGSGKTAVLTERVLSYILNAEDPCDIGQLLIVTFTKAAAEEMKDRIARKLSEKISENPFDKRLRRQQLLLQKANISTIHAFCSNLLRNHFQSAGLSADFRITEKSELDLLKSEALSQTLEEAYAAENNQAFLSLVELYAGGRDDTKLSRMILTLYEFLRAAPFPEIWMQNSLAAYRLQSTEIAESCWGAIALRHARSCVSYAVHKLEEGITLIFENPDDLDIQTKYASVFQTDLEQCRKLRNALENPGWETIREMVHAITFQRLPALRNYPDLSKKEAVQACRDAAKACLGSLQSGIFSYSSETVLQDVNQLYPHLESLFQLTTHFIGNLDARKSEKKLVDFSDLEQYTLRLLVTHHNGIPKRTALAEEIGKQYREILVDEYQDTNQIQDLIFWAISKENQFLVGDIKQSIYRFRQAMPEIFLHKKNSYPLYGNTYPAKILLSSNFRSRKGITAFINKVFSELMSPELGELAYNEEEALLPAAVYPPSDAPEVELHLLEQSDPDVKSLEIEAQFIGEKIRTLLRQKRMVTDKGHERPLCYGDIAILLRAAKGKSDDFVRALQKMDIPVWSETAAGFFHCYEIEVLVSLLRILDNPLQDVPLLSVMLSPLYDFTPDDLCAIRIENRKGQFYHAVRTAGENGNQKVKQFLEGLDRLRSLAAVMTADELVLKILYDYNFLEIASAMPEGERREANLRLFLTYAQKFEEAGYQGLNGWIGFIDRLLEAGSDFSATPPASDVGNAVRIMSIHHAKGLEFPVVFLANCKGNFNTTDLNENVLFHPHLGFGTKLTENFRIRNTLPREAIALSLKNEMLSEEMRTLYVAMTRAREQLYLTIPTADAGALLNKALSLRTGDHVDSYAAQNAPNFAMWVLAGALDPSTVKQLENHRETPIAFSEHFLVQIHHGTPESPASESVCEKSPASPPSEPAPLPDEILKRFRWRYPYACSANIPSKLSVSELSHKSPQNNILKRPAFLSDSKGLSGAEAGTALHLFIEHLDLSSACRESLEKQAENLVRAQFLTEAQRNAIPFSKVRTFLRSSICIQMRNAEKIYRELKFALQLPSEIVLPEEGVSGASVFVQGIIDCAFFSNGRLILVDYKSDRVTSAGTLIELYHRQLLIYAKALAEIFSVPVDQAVIYSFHLEQEINCPLIPPAP